MNGYNEEQPVTEEELKFDQWLLKFRAWNPVVEQFSDPFGIRHSTILWRRKNDNNISYRSLLPSDIVMRFTGFFDKSGKEIFQGDIIQNVADDGAKLSVFEVLYDTSRGGFCKRRIDDNEIYPLESSRFHLVIGNVFQDKHLLS